jgi:hypothetical protein
LRLVGTRVGPLGRWQARLVESGAPECRGGGLGREMRSADPKRL